MIKATIQNVVTSETRVQLDLPLWLVAMIWRWSYSGIASPEKEVPEIRELNNVLFTVLSKAVAYPTDQVPHLTKCGPGNLNVDPRVFKAELAKVIGA